MDNYCLQVFFDNGETKIYDMSELLEKSFYSRLKNKNLFNTVTPFEGVGLAKTGAFLFSWEYKVAGCWVDGGLG